VAKPWLHRVSKTVRDSFLASQPQPDVSKLREELGRTVQRALEVGGGSETGPLARQAHLQEVARPPPKPCTPNKKRQTSSPGPKHKHLNP
jgi:hypothetical protein